MFQIFSKVVKVDEMWLVKVWWICINFSLSKVFIVTQRRWILGCLVWYNILVLWAVYRRCFVLALCDVYFSTTHTYNIQTRCTICTCILYVWELDTCTSHKRNLSYLQMYVTQNFLFFVNFSFLLIFNTRN